MEDPQALPWYGSVIEDNPNQIICLIICCQKASDGPTLCHNAYIIHSRQAFLTVRRVRTGQ